MIELRRKNKFIKLNRELGDRMRQGNTERDWGIVSPINKDKNL